MRPTGTLRHWLTWCLLGGSLLILAECGTPPDNVTSPWTEKMLGGSFGVIGEGVLDDDKPPGPIDLVELEKNDGSIFGASSTKQLGIRVNSEPGRRAFWPGEAWHLRGGLIRRVPVGDGALELYGKEVAHTTLDIFPHLARFKDEFVEIFLLYRSAPSARATIVQKWMLSPEARSGRGYLLYDAALQRARVRFSESKESPKTLLDESVDVSKVVNSSRVPTKRDSQHR